VSEERKLIQQLRAFVVEVKFDSIITPEHCDEHLHAIDAHLRSHPAPGFVLVPVEPTEKMHVAAVRAAFKATGNSDFPGLVLESHDRRSRKGVGSGKL